MSNLDLLVIPADNRILYYNRDRDAFGCFSHFHPAKIIVDGEEWKTAEHYYQSRKSIDPDYVQAIREAISPGHAKQLGAPPAAPRKVSGQSWFRRQGKAPRADWHEVKLDIMRRTDWAKFSQHPELAAILMATGDAELVEDSPREPYWGVGPDGNGFNWAGKVLMEVRDRLRITSASL